MATIDILEAKTQFLRLVERVETGADAEILIARNGRPVARLVPLAALPTQRRIGVAKGCFTVPESIDGSNAEVADLLAGVPTP
jgi:prevent-host-death family protein